MRVSFCMFFVAACYQAAASMYACMHACIYVCVLVCVCVCVCVRMHVWMYVRTYACVCPYMSVWILDLRPSPHTGECFAVNVASVCTDKCVYIFVCMWICIHIHMHITHTYAQVVLVVNVASVCGYTDKEYRRLVNLHNTYSDKGFDVIAFPSNQVCLMWVHHISVCKCVLVRKQIWCHIAFPSN